MEDHELKNIWQAYNRQLEEARILNMQTWVVHMQTVEYLQLHKAQSRLQSLGRFKTGIVVLGIVWCLFLGVLVWGNWFKNPYFTISVGMLLLFNLLAVILYIYHIVLIRRISYSESVTGTQQQLAKLQASTLKAIRILWLQMPFYCTWFWHSSWIDYGSARFWLITFPITLFFTVLAIWLYKQIDYKNRHKKWFRLLMGGKEWTTVVKAMDYLDEINRFKQEEQVHLQNG
ncbi:hypothetical protein [Deminuibacter soli]|uniref:Uncharacterized protein n=1 Tax=Deminuibacter soli TaxID=2291815 RepID=A0A3E1NCL1_9BACT|nr:hypothetical protein [Deminuibacter soli]RFM25749.1 hypothetical protein DXN05_23235 [Deminuibacter soli]